MWLFLSECMSLFDLCKALGRIAWFSALKYSFDNLFSYIIFYLVIFVSCLQLLVEILRFSALTFSTLLRFTDFGDKELMDTVEIFISEVLNLTKDSISHAKVICFSQ